MAYLVTGGTGLVGSRIVCDLVKGGERVVVYELYPQEGLLERLLSEAERASVKVVQGNVTDLPYLMRTVKENDVDRIIHVAALLLSGCLANPYLAVKINCEGTANIFETARLLGLEKVVWSSSVGVYGPPEKYPQEYVPNDAPHYPGSVYAASKSFSEALASHYVDQYGMDISAIRYSLVYGVGQSLGGGGVNAQILRELVENPVAGKPGQVPFGDDAIGWLYADDAARATVLMSKVARPKTKAFNIGGDLRPMREVVDYVRSLLPDAQLTLLPGYVAGGIVWKFDTTPLYEEIGYRSEWPMERGIKDVINTVRRQYRLPPV